jgi:hypothetical protein
MSKLPQEGRFDRNLDAAKELTGLEYEATRRPLTGPEQQRLEQLRQAKDRLIASQREKELDESRPDSTVVSGDDSP